MMTAKHLAMGSQNSHTTTLTPLQVHQHRQEQITPSPQKSSEVATHKTITIEHRQGRRCKMLALAAIQFRDGQHAAAVIGNISANGMFIITEETLTVNECVEVQIPQPGAAQSTLRFPGLVVHTNNHGFGMLFRELDDAAHQLVRWWLDEK